MVKDESSLVRTYILPLGVALAFIALWGVLSALRDFPKSAFPSPLDVLYGFREELVTGRLWNDLVASLFRVSVGFVLAVVLSIPLGLLLGQHQAARAASPYFRQDEMVVRYVLTEPTDRVSYRMLTPTDEELQKIHDVAFRMKLLSKPVPMSELIDRSFIPVKIKAAEIK